MVQCVTERGLQVGALGDQVQRAVEVLLNCPLKGVAQLRIGVAHFIIPLRVVGAAHRLGVGAGVALCRFVIFARLFQERKRVTAQERMHFPFEFAVARTGGREESGVHEIGELLLRRWLVALPHLRGKAGGKGSVEGKRAEGAPTSLGHSIERTVAKGERTFDIFLAFVGGQRQPLELLSKYNAVTDGAINPMLRRAPRRDSPRFGTTLATTLCRHRYRVPNRGAA